MSNYVGKSIGARRLVWFPLINDPDTGVPTYGAPIKLSRLIQITRTPVMASGTLESDDGVEDNINLLRGYDVSINASQMTDFIRATLLGHSIDAGGGMTISGNDVATEGALAWEEPISSKTTGTVKYKKWLLYKGSFSEFAETADTSVEGGITYQTHNLTGKFTRRNDGLLAYTIREDSPNVNASKIAEWFNTPQEADGSYETTVASVTATPAAGAVANGTDVTLVSSTVGASIRYTLDGSTPHAGSRVYDGPITISTATTVKAIAVKSGMNTSTVFTSAYTVN